MIYRVYGTDRAGDYRETSVDAESIDEATAKAKTMGIVATKIDPQHGKADDYPALKIIILLYQIAAAVIFLGGLGGTAFVFQKWSGDDSTKILISLGIVVTAGVTSITLLARAEIILILVRIEENTRKR